MTETPKADDAKHKAEIAAKEKEIADLKSKLADRGDGAVDTDVIDDDLQPTPTQAELNAVKAGEHHGKPGRYRDRQMKAD